MIRESTIMSLKEALGAGSLLKMMQRICTSFSQRRLSDAEADVIAERICGKHYRDVLPMLECEERKSALARLKLVGLSIRQIEGLTGIGRGVIAKAKL